MSTGGDAVFEALKDRYTLMRELGRGGMDPLKGMARFQGLIKER